ncbi:chaplin [Streptomyces sp. NPDC056401]|uniref:chaplin n=1 Tax=Streptomyces sp. NPDC056401 TaxID=3345809 RepID=UPI0035D54B1D
MFRVLKGAAVTLTAVVAVLGAGSAAMADADAQGIAAYSPGVGSGNLIQIPIHIPINACGNSVSVIGLLNPAFGNTCVNA